MEAKSPVFFKGGASEPEPVPSGFLSYFEEENVSVFESMRSYGGVIFRLEDHLARLFRSAKTAGLRIREKPSQLKKALYRILSRSGERDAFLRLTVTPQGWFVIVTVKSYPREIFERGVRVRTSAVKKGLSNSVFPEAKTSSYGGQMLATVEMPGDVFEVLFLSPEGYVRESRTSNIFMLKGNLLSTPPLVAVLEGVTRKVVEELARDMGLAFLQDELTRHDFFNADEVFLSNTSGEIIPVCEMDGRRIGKGAPGMWTNRLRRAFAGEVLRYRKEHARVKG